jgi:hypothetical protein
MSSGFLIVMIEVQRSFGALSSGVMMRVNVGSLLNDEELLNDFETLRGSEA